MFPDRPPHEVNFAGEEYDDAPWFVDLSGSSSSFLCAGCHSPTKYHRVQFPATAIQVRDLDCGFLVNLMVLVNLFPGLRHIML